MILATPTNLRKAEKHLMDNDPVLAAVITEVGPCR